MIICKALTLFTALLCISAMGSPIQHVIESKADLNALGVTITTTAIDQGTPDKHRSTKFEVAWSSKDNGPTPPKRMINFLVFKSGMRAGGAGNPFAPTGSRFTISLGENRKKPISSTFTASEEELETTVLAFWQQSGTGFGWDSVHFLVLKTVVDGFPAPKDPFEKP